MSNRQYVWRPGSRFADKEADVVAQEIEDIRARKGTDELKPADLVEAASKDESSVIHTCFEWNDSVAAHEHRLQTARKLLRDIQIVVNEAEPPRHLNVNVVLPKTNGSQTEQRAYVPLDVAINDAALYRQLLERALRELEQAEKRYAHLRELGPVFTAVKAARAAFDLEVTPNGQSQLEQMAQVALQQ